MRVIRQSESRRTATPNAVMITHASPTQGGATLSVWRVEMAPGAAGPLHIFDVEQVWTTLEGAATIELNGETVALGPGDTVVLPAEAQRRVHADPTMGFTAVVAASAGARARTPGSKPVLPEWIA